MERRFSKIGKNIDIYARVIDKPTDDLDRRLHGGIVNRAPIALIPVIDINR